MNEALSPLAVATVDASNGAAPFASTKIVAVDGVPDQFLITRTVDRCWVFVIVQLMVAPSTAGEVTGNGPPAYGCSAAPPHWIVAA